MEKIQIMLRNGKFYNATTENFNTEEYLSTLNNPNLIAVKIGNQPVAKQGILYYKKDTTEPINTIVEFQNGLKLECYAEQFDADAITQNLNNNKNMFIAIGNLILIKNQFLIATPVEIES